MEGGGAEAEAEAIEMDWERKWIGDADRVGAGHGLAGMVMAVVIRSSARLVALLACLELYYLLLLHVVVVSPRLGFLMLLLQHMAH